MAKIGASVVLCLMAAVVMWQPSPLRAQDKKLATDAPIPSQILTGKTAFISNEGGYASPSAIGKYGDDPVDTYNEFYAAMKDWGRFRLVSTPVEADLVFGVRFMIVQPESGLWADPQVRLVILDPKMHVTLWSLVEHVEPGNLQGTRNKNLKAAVDKAVSDVKELLVLQS